MANKGKTFSKFIKDLYEYQKLDKAVLSYDIDGEHIEIEVLPDISLQDRRDFITMVYSAYYCQSDDGSFDYHPEAVEPAIRFATFSKYTNLRTDGRGSLNSIYEALMHTDLYDTVIDKLDENYANLVNETHEYLRIQREEHNKNIIDGLVINLLAKVSNLADKILDTNFDDETMREKIFSFATNVIDAAVKGGSVNGGEQQ